MSCAAVAVAAVLMLGGAEAAAVPPAAVSAVSSGPVSAEPLFVDIVSRAQGLKSIVDGWAASGAADASGFAAGATFADFRSRALDLADLNMRGHFDLAARGVDNDLKCILRGIAEDLPGRLDAVAGAGAAPERAEALAELSHLLDDNAAVILAPPAGS